MKIISEFFDALVVTLDVFVQKFLFLFQRLYQNFLIDKNTVDFVTLVEQSFIIVFNLLFIIIQDRIIFIKKNFLISLPILQYVYSFLRILLGEIFAVLRILQEIFYESTLDL